MGTKSDPGPFDCHAAAEDDEPIFVLLARDSQAPARVRDWADVREDERGANDPKAVQAREIALEMERWKKERKC